MNVSHVTIPFDKIEEVLGLPDTARIVAAKEHESGRFVVMRVIADTLPRDFALGPGDPLSKIGESYQPTLEPTVVVEGESDSPHGPVS